MDRWLMVKSKAGVGENIEGEEIAMWLKL